MITEKHHEISISIILWEWICFPQTSNSAKAAVQKQKRGIIVANPQSAARSIAWIVWGGLLTQWLGLKSKQKSHCQSNGSDRQKG